MGEMNRTSEFRDKEYRAETIKISAPFALYEKFFAYNPAF